MKKWLLPTLIVSILAVSASVYAFSDSITPTSTANVSTSQSLPTIDELLTGINAERAKVGVKPLVLDPLLNQSAQWKSQDQVVNHYFGHSKPGETAKNGLMYLDSIDSTDKCEILSENLMHGTEYFATSKGVVIGWMDSPAHRSALLDPKFSITGFGVSKSGDTVYVTEHFCKVY